MLSREERRFLEAPEMGPVKAFVAGAFADIARQPNRPSFQYTHILQQLQQRDDPEMLWRIYICLADFVVQIAHRPDAHKNLLQNLLSFDWRAAENVVVAYVHLIGLLVSANPNFLPPVAQMIVRNLVADGSDAGSVSRHVRLHDTLRCILSLSPGGQAGLYSTLTEMFPYKLQQKETLVTYVKETLLMCEYLPHFQQRILDLVVARCIEIDVDIEIDADTETARSPLPSDQREAHDEDMFAFEDDVSSRGVAPQSSGGRRVRISSEGLADSLDGMLCVVLRFVEAQFNHKDTAARERVFLQLIGIFERRLLTTHRSKFVQFIIFYMCAKHNDYGEIFCRRLLDVFFQTKNVTDQRHGAVMYLASFFCRSLSCSAQVIRNGTADLMRWINLYGEIHAKDNITDIEHELRDGSNKLFVVGKEGQPSLKHESLYLTVQAVCTILCFHGDSLWTHYLSIDVELCSQFLSVLSLFRPLRFARPSFSVAFHRLLSRTAAAANTAGVSLPDEHIIVPAASFGGYRSQDLGGYVGDMDMHGGMGSAVETIWGVVSKAPHDFICPFDPCLLDGVASLVNCGYQIYFDEQGSELSQKFNNLTAFAPLVSRTHADSEGDRSSATSLMWPGTTQNEEGKPFEEGSSYESSLLPSLDMYRGDDSHSNAIPPRHPVTNSGEEWTPAPLSRQRRRNRRKIGDSSEEHDFSGTSVYQSVVPQSFVMTRGDDVGLTFKSQSSVLGEKTPFSHLLQPTINVKNKGDNAFGAVPTFDRFAVPAAIFRESSGQTAMGISTGTKHSPALNDFQKRAREYSVGSVGSW